MSVFRQLHEGWTLSAASPTPVAVAAVPATVPGCVHTDLLAAELIKDPFIDARELELNWIGRTDWIYETTFDWEPTAADQAPTDRVDLVCAGLDTVATVTLNGVELGRTANMHRTYRFDARPGLRAGENRLAVRFDSAYRYTDAVRAVVGERPSPYDEPYQYIRKMACNFGWDWGPTVVTAGIWRSIGLHSWSTARLAEVVPLVTVQGQTGVVEARVRVERTGSDPLTVTAAVDGIRAEVTLAAGQTDAVVRVEVADPALWWPRGYGDQPRYDLEVGLLAADRSTLDSRERRIGFRSLRLDQTPDPDGLGSRFAVVVNDQPVFVRGVNWIPDDAFITRVTRDDYATRLAQACAANINLLRVWGGGIYESEDFYDLADEHGLLVEQDFLFACAAYPEEDPIATEVAAEAREQVARLASHPSLAWWTGNNENLWGFVDWGWEEPLAGRSWGAGYYHEVLPSIVAEIDPTREYQPGSPYSGAPDRHPNDPAYGTSHIWDVWNTHDYTHYRTWQPRFVAEFGFQGPPAFATLRRAVSDDPLTPDSPGVMHHQKADDGNAKLLRGLTGHLPLPEVGSPHAFDDWHWATQLNQARAITYGVEHLRSLRPYCMGGIVWQLNDCWPVTSWAAVDGDGRRKPLWYALRRAFADRLLTIQPRQGTLAAVAVNDGRTRWQTQFEVIRTTFAGEPRAKTTLAVDLAPGEAVTLPLPADITTPDDPMAELLVADHDHGRATWMFVEDVQARLPAPVYDVNVTPQPHGALIAVTAHTFLRDLALFPDRLDPAATVDDLLHTLLPGETATFAVYAGGPNDDTIVDPAVLEHAAVSTRPVLRSANDLFHHSTPPGSV